MWVRGSGWQEADGYGMKAGESGKKHKGQSTIVTYDIKLLSCIICVYDYWQNIKWVVQVMAMM